MTVAGGRRGATRKQLASVGAADVHRPERTIADVFVNFTFRLGRGLSRLAMRIALRILAVVGRWFEAGNWNQLDGSLRQLGGWAAGGTALAAGGDWDAPGPWAGGPWAAAVIKWTQLRSSRCFWHLRCARALLFATASCCSGRAVEKQLGEPLSIAGR